ncbi:MAG: anion transporter [Roseiarcus sp.]|jgi:Na+/H+ antiporter NhaD/arsenite permease-like protein
MSSTNLRFRLLGLWMLSFVACVAVGLLLALLDQQSTASRVSRAAATLAKGCDSIRDQYRVESIKWPESRLDLSDATLRASLMATVGLALAGRDRVEGGVWQKDAGSLAYAFPTYAGTGPKTDLPAAERDAIGGVNDEAARSGLPADRQSASAEETLLLRACPLPGPIAGLTAWTMTRVDAAPYLDQLRLALGVLLGLMALMSAWLGRVLILWARYTRTVEAAPSVVSVSGAPAWTGEREMERAVVARRDGQSPVVARHEPENMAAQLTQVERMALGLVGAIVALALLAAVATFASPSSVYRSDAARLAAGAIFGGTYLALAIGKIPGLGIDRAGVALVGGCLMIVSGVLTMEEASQAVDSGTIALLLGAMIVVANLRLSGFFGLVNGWIARHVRRPIALLCAVAAVAGLFSAILVNDAICLVLSPLVLELTLDLRRKPTPYLLAVAMASNVGSAATITGNPQNIMIGSFSHLPYLRFASALTPVAFAGLLLTILFVALAYRDEFFVDDRLAAVPRATPVEPALLARALAATAIMVALFFAGQPAAKAAIVMGGLLLLTRLKSERIYAEIDWSLLLMFVGLFIVVAGAQHALLTPDVLDAAGRLHLDQLPMLSLVTAVLSNIVSNVPAVLMLKPFVEALKDHDRAWLIIAMASTLAGNFTVLGSVANLIVVQTAAASGVTISFWDYFRVGAPLTIVTLAIGTLWLWL